MQKKDDFEKRNLVFAIIISAFMLFAVDKLFPSPEIQQGQPAPVVSTQIENNEKAQQQTIATKTVNEVLNENAHLNIETETVSGSIRLTGARFDNLSLKKYRETLDETSPAISLFSPINTALPFFAEFGWISNDYSLKLPNSSTPWKTSDTTLTTDSPVTLTWDNKEGLKFFRQISIDKNYMFTVTDRVENYGKKDVFLFNYGSISRINYPETRRGAVLEGMVGFAGNGLKEFNYAKMEKEKQASFDTKAGWAGITDKYWMSILVFDQEKDQVNIRFSANETDAGKHFQADYRLPPFSIKAGENAQVSAHLFAGPKEVKLIDNYKKDLDIKRFDLTIDFGWYYFLTKPFFFILSWFYGFFGNMGLAILFFAFLLRLAMFPIANKTFRNMERMKALQPKVEKLKEKYADDKMRMNQEMMLLYKTENVSPAAGCLPMLIQIPVFFSLYKVLYISLELRHAPFYGWIQDLSAPDPSSIFSLCGLIPWSVPSAIDIGVWPLLMGITMWLQQKMSPKPADKSQATVMSIMPWLMTFMLGNLASGLIIYWTWSNLLSIAQQYALRFKKVK